MGGAMIDQAISGGIQAYGQVFQGDAQANAYKYNAAVARQNSQAALENAQLAAESGTATATMVSMKNRQTYDSTKAQQAASGVDVNSGSAVDVRASEQELGVTDAYNSRVAAVREAYGYQVQSVNDKSEAQLEDYQADISQEAGYLGAAGTLIGTIGKEEDMYSQYLQMGGFSG